MRPTPTPFLPLPLLLPLLHHPVLYWCFFGALLVLYWCTILCSIGCRLFCLPPSFGNCFSGRQVDHIYELVQCGHKQYFGSQVNQQTSFHLYWSGCRRASMKMSGLCTMQRPLTSSIKRFRQYRPGDARPSLVWVFGIWGPYTVVAPHQAYQGPSNTALSISEGIVVISKWSVPKSQKGCDHPTPSLAMLGSWSHCRHSSLWTNFIPIYAPHDSQGPLSTCWLFQVRILY